MMKHNINDITNDELDHVALVLTRSATLRCHILASRCRTCAGFLAAKFHHRDHLASRPSGRSILRVERPLLAGNRGHHSAFAAVCAAFEPRWYRDNPKRADPEAVRADHAKGRGLA